MCGIVDLGVQFVIAEYLIESRWPLGVRIARIRQVDIRSEGPSFSQSGFSPIDWNLQIRSSGGGPVEAAVDR
jgi:hypothetical protein